MKELKEYISKLADELVDANPEEYENGIEDYGYYNNGVGMACYGKIKTYDYVRAREDAKDAIINDLEIMAGRRDGCTNAEVEKLLCNCPKLVGFLEKVIMRG